MIGLLPAILPAVDGLVNDPQPSGECLLVEPGDPPT